MMTYYQEMKKICSNRESHLYFNDDIGEEQEYMLCKYMINYYVNNNISYMGDGIEPTVEYCLKCPYRNKNMGEKFEIKR